MENSNNYFTPESDNLNEVINEALNPVQEKVDKSACPCCGNLTIPNREDALGFICPVCFWEIDTFTTSDNEPSDQNSGMSLIEARLNYKNYKACSPVLTKFCREPHTSEIPK